MSATTGGLPVRMRKLGSVLPELGAPGRWRPLEFLLMMRC